MLPGVTTCTNKRRRGRGQGATRVLERESLVSDCCKVQRDRSADPTFPSLQHNRAGQQYRTAGQQCRAAMQGSDAEQQQGSNAAWQGSSAMQPRAAAVPPPPCTAPASCNSCNSPLQSACTCLSFFLLKCTCSALPCTALPCSLLPTFPLSALCLL